MMRKTMYFSVILTACVVESAFIVQQIRDVSFEMSSASKPSPEEYRKLRGQFMSEQLNRGLGANVSLSAKEELANAIIMKAKNKEMDDGFKDPRNFAPARHFFDVLDQIKVSPLFQLIRLMPKGAILHAHDTSLCSTDFIVNTLLYLDNLWQQGELLETNKPVFKFAPSKPEEGWRLVADERRKVGKATYDTRVRKLFTLYTEDPLNTYKDINVVWTKFIDIFISLDPIVTYLPAWKLYFYNALREFYEDGVLYLEFRGTLPNVHDFDRSYSPEEIVGIYVDVLAQFQHDYPDFIGCKFIYAPQRLTDDTEFDNYMDLIIKLHSKYPKFVAGFDLVGQEDLGRPLIDYADRLLKLPESIKFFFHAGETNWNGKSSDENLIDAVLLGTKRIGHGFAVVKNPKILEEIKARQICIEINPISNQVLKLVDDYRNHPAAIYFSDNYPVVVSSDDPSFWEATPLSHDFYEAFLGIASAHHDLRLLKKLALNSLEYSAMTSAELVTAKIKWENAWNVYVDRVVSEGDKF